jgi:hypothetical protein
MGQSINGGGGVGEAMGHEERERERACVCRVWLCSIGPGKHKNRANFLPPPAPIKSLNCCPTSWHNLKTVHVDCSTPLNSLPPRPSPFSSTSTPPLLVRQALSLSLSLVFVALISFSSCLLCGQSFSREFQRLGCTVLSNYHKFGTSTSSTSEARGLEIVLSLWTLPSFQADLKGFVCCCCGLWVLKTNQVFLFVGSATLCASYKRLAGKEVVVARQLAGKEH